MSSAAKDGTASSASLDDALERQFDALSSDVDAEAKSDAATSVHAWRSRVEQDRLESEVENLREQIRTQADTRAMRRSYAREAIGLARAAVMFWVGMFFVVGFSNAMAGKVPFSDQALVTLTAGATVNVLAAFIGIIRGLFPAGVGVKSNGSDAEKKSDG